MKIDIKFSEQNVRWDEPCDETPETYYHMEEAMAASEAAKQIKDILDAKCKAADLEKVCPAQSHLVLQKRQRLCNL